MVRDLPQPGGPETSGVTLPVCATVQKIRFGVVLQGIGHPPAHGVKVGKPSRAGSHHGAEGIALPSRRTLRSRRGEVCMTAAASAPLATA